MKNILIGFLMATCIFLMIGATDEVESMDWYVTGEVTVEDVEGNLVIAASENGRYQAFGESKGIYMIDTTTGVTYYLTPKLKWKRHSPKTDWIKE